MPIEDPDAANYWLTCMTIDPVDGCSSRYAVIVALEAADVEARPLWKPLHMKPVFQDCASIGGECAEGLFATGLCLPSGSALSEADRSKVIEGVRACFVTQ